MTNEERPLVAAARGQAEAYLTELRAFMAESVAAGTTPEPEANAMLAYAELSLSDVTSSEQVSNTSSGLKQRWPDSEPLRTFLLSQVIGLALGSYIEENYDELSTKLRRTVNEEKEEAVSMDVISDDTVTPVFLFDLFDAAFMKPEFRDERTCVRIIDDSQPLNVRKNSDDTLVYFSVGYSCRESATLADKLLYVNLVNDSLKLVRASVMNDGGIWFDAYVNVDGGVTRKNLVLCTKRIASAIRAALSKDEKDLIE